MLVYGLLCLAALSVMTEGQRFPRREQRPWAMGASPNGYPAPSQAQAQHRFRPRPPVDDRQQPRNNQPPPQGWRDLMSNVHTPDDFVHMLVYPNGSAVGSNDLFSPHETADGKRVITGGGVLATSDECSPRNMSVRLPLDFTDSQVAYYPECTQVQRCGGCTPSSLLSCEAEYKEKIVLKVLRARYLYPGALSMRWEGFSSVEVERHLTCQVVCNLEPGDCRSGQSFNPYQCKCECMRSERCSSGKVWDADNCRCRCANEGPCCAEPGGEDDRTCNAYFDPDFCECTLKTSIGASPNASREEIQQWLESRNRNTGPTQPPINAPTTTTTTTTTTTQAPETTEGACRCPPRFIGVRNPYGRCVCLIRAPSRRHRNSRRRG